MNSEELELSLRTEFESHLRDVLADLRQEFAHFQDKFQAEFDKHKSQLDTVFQDFSGRIETGKQLDQGFKEAVVEHLRLARDEGARITATAIAEAEEMQRQAAPTEILSAPLMPAAPTIGIRELRDAIKDITAQDSQGTILKSLVQHAAQFTPRGAFFIIKNEHFVGWRVFSKEGEADEDAVRKIQLPTATDSVLGESVRSLSAVESSFGTYSDDAAYLDQIQFGEPERMIAIPLIARGRGVAVLYADDGTQGEQVNVEALETLVRVAGLTVEMLASASQATRYVQPEAPAAVSYSPPAPEVQPVEIPAEQSSAQFTEQPAEQLAQPEETHQTEVVETKEEEYSPIAEPTETFSENTFRSEEILPNEYPVEVVEDVQEISVEPMKTVEADETDKPEKSDDLQSGYTAPASTDFHFTESAKVEKSPSKDFDSLQSDAVENFEPTETFSAPAEVYSAPTETFSAKDDFSGSLETFSGGTATYAPEPAAVVETVAAAPVKSRFSDRNVDLPIEVSEDERRLHNDARRFARLLVSEIKLYNEQKVKEGRERQDLYDRLREAIDRSRDMYDKRVQPPVAAKFDYFHYELVSTLAEGEATKLGGDYPGAAVR